MKKLIALTFALVLALSLAACTPNEGGDGNSGNTNTPSSNPANSPSANPSASESAAGNQGTAKTLSITPAEGWEKNNSVQPMWLHSSPYGSISLTTDTIPDNKSADEYVTYAQGKIKEALSDAEFSNASNIKIGGMDAVEYTYTTTQKVGVMKFRVIYVCENGKAYTITCGSIETDYDSLSDDYQAMVDSFTLE